jgi:hypothetical protein
MRRGYPLGLLSLTCCFADFIGLGCFATSARAFLAASICSRRLIRPLYQLSVIRFVGSTVIAQSLITLSEAIRSARRGKSLSCTT